jgi:hypothetical protein
MADSYCKFCAQAGLTWVESSGGYKLCAKPATEEELKIIRAGRTSDGWLAIHGHPRIYSDSDTGERWISHSCEAGLNAWKAKKAVSR